MAVPEKPEGDGQSSDSSDGASDSRTQLTITRKVRIQIARTEKSRKNQTVTDSPQRLRIFHFLTFKEGDIVSITLDEDGNAASITVMSMKWAVRASLAVMDKRFGTGGPDGQSQGVDSYTAANEYTRRYNCIK